MKARTKTGHIVHRPLDKLFDMIPKGGSLQQKYDAVSGEYIADRTLTPMVLQPSLQISDPSGVLADGDYTSSMVNVVWRISGTIGGHPLTEGTHYVIDPVTYSLTLMANLDPDTSGIISFSADFIDSRRKDVLKCKWEDSLTCISESVWKVTLETLWPMRTDLFPWKDRGQMAIGVQLRNGSEPLPDNRCVYRWQIFDSESWRYLDLDYDLWCLGGQNSKELQVVQKYIEHVVLRCVAYPADNPAEVQFASFLLRRFCGYYDDDLDFVQGAYIFPETMQAAAEAYVVKRNGGLIATPEKYFDIEIFYTRGDGQWWHVAHGTEGAVPRSMFPIDATMTHKFGEVTRELSAFLPLAVDGAFLAFGGRPLVAQVPIIERNVDEL